MHNLRVSAFLLVLALSGGCGNSHAPARATTPSAVAMASSSSEAPPPAPAPSAVFGLTEGSKRLVCKTLTSDMLVEVYLTRGAPKLNAFADKVMALAMAYERATYVGKDENGHTTEYKSHIHLSIHDPMTAEDKLAAKDAGLVQRTFGEAAEGAPDSAILTTGYLGIVFKYGAEMEVIPTLDPSEDRGLEFIITNQLRSLHMRASGKTTRIGVIAQKDEIKLSDNNLAPTKPGQVFNMQGVFHQYVPFYEFVDVDLHGGDAEIDRELTAIFITQPGKDYSEKELRRIDQFLMRGHKSLVVFASAVNVQASAPKMRATLSTHGLERLLDGYGIEMKRDALFDAEGCFQIGQSGTPPLRVPWALFPADDDHYAGDKALLDDSFAPFFRMKEISMPFASSLVVHREKQPSTRLRVVARTRADAVAKSDETIDMLATIASPPNGGGPQRDVAVAIEPGCCDGRAQCDDSDPCKPGKLRSAFVSGDAMGIEAPAESRGASRVFVVSSAQYTANPFARAGNPADATPKTKTGQAAGNADLLMIARPYYERSLTETVLTLKNTLDWVSGDDDMMALTATLLPPSNAPR